MSSLYRIFDDFFKQGLWKSIPKRAFFKRYVYYVLRLLVISVRGYYKDDCALKSSALTLLSILSLIPVIVLLLGLGRGLGFDLHEQIAAFLPGKQSTIQVPLIPKDQSSNGVNEPSSNTKSTDSDTTTTDEIQSMDNPPVDLTKWVFNRVDELLEKTRGSLIAAAGLMVLFYTVMRLLHNVEEVFNSI